MQSSPYAWLSNWNVSVKFLPSLQQNFIHTRCSSSSFIVTLSLIRRTACARARFSGCSLTTNAHSETGQMAVCCLNLTIGALSSRSALSLLVGALFKKFGLFLNTPRSVGGRVLVWCGSGYAHAAGCCVHGSSYCCSINTGNSWLLDDPFPSREGLCSMLGWLVGSLPSLWQVLTFRSDTVMVEADWSVDLAAVNIARVSAWQVAMTLAGGIPNCQCVCWGHAGGNWHAWVRDYARRTTVVVCDV